MSPTTTGDRRQLDRMLAFSDAVLAIAITLVALPLVDAARDGDTNTTSFFVDNAAALIAAAVSFVAITVFWRIHHEVFARAQQATPFLTYVNAGFLAAVTFLPVATVLDVDSGGNDRASLVVYVSCVLLAIVALQGERLLLTRHEQTAAVTAGLRHAAASVVLGVVALAVVIVAPVLYLFPLALLALGRPLGRLFDEIAARVGRPVSRF